ncbi:MAG TPA: hypothetical protein VFU21_00050 [Kofleriaceae bacterium]|nr:hypothetical protein [Kofleriaceae bacterium]
MTPPRRHALVLAAAAAALNALAGARTARAEKFDATTQAALSRLPGDALLVAGLDVKAARRTAIFKKLAAAAAKDAKAKVGIASMKTGAGFDYRRDIDRVWLVVPSDAAGGRDRMAFLAKGRVDQARFVTWLKTSEKAELKRAGKLTYYRTGDSAWAFLGDGWLLLAHADYVQQVLEAHARGAGRAIDDAALMTAVRTAARSSSHAWIATVIPAQLKSKLREETFTRTFADLEWSAASATFGKSIKFRGEVRAATAEAASALAGALTMVVQMAAGNKDLADAGLAASLSATAISSKDRTVSFSGSLPAGKLASVIGRLIGS